MANYPNRSKFRIEVGKSYLTRDGDRVTIEAETAYRGTWSMQGTDGRGRLTWHSAAGRFTDRPHAADLVAETE